MTLAHDAGPAGPAGPASRRGFRPDIEGLRGLAILLVVAYHAGIPGFSGGYVGVDVFFVLSGYLITGLLIDEIRSTGRVDFLAFYARRARRLLPAAVLVVIVTLLVGRWMYAPLDHRELANSGIATALYISNLYFARSATDYLAHEDPSPLLHTWSLAVEEQFYLFWPAIVLLGFAGCRSKPQLGRLVITMGVMALASLAFCVWLTGVSQPWAFFVLPTRAWEFAAGALVRMLPENPRRALRPHLLALAGTAAVLVAGMRFDAQTVFPGSAAILPVAGTAMLLAAGAANAAAGPFIVLASRLMQWIGTLSYSWYLWHWPVLIYGRSFRELEGPVAGVALAIFALGLAALTHRVVENPIRFHRTLVTRPGLSLGLALMLTLSGAATGAAVRIIGQRQAAAPPQSIYAQARDLPRIYTDGCHADQHVTIPERCTYGDTTSASTIVLFGDSHAAQWFPPLERIADEHGLALVSFTKSACPAADVEIENPQLGRTYSECTTWRENVIRRILDIRPMAVIISNFNGYIATEGSASRWTTSEEAWRKGVHRVTATFDSAGIRTVLLADTPLPGFDVPSCLSRLSWNSFVHRNRCVFQRNTPRGDIAHRIDREVAMAMAHAVFIDLTDAVCSEPVCRGEVDGVVRYRDAHHLTTDFAASLAPLLARQIFDGLAH